MNATIPDLKNWLPIRVVWRGDTPAVEWCFFDTLPLTHPFYGASVVQRMFLPFNQFFRHRTPLENLESIAKQFDSVSPQGFIFHLSRCGSTLISQMLAAIPENIVLSEPSPLDSILTSAIRDPRITEEQRIEWFRALVTSLSQRRSGAEQRSFIKFDSWHTLFLPLISKAYPNVPKIFLYRDPVEIIVSQLTKRGSQTIVGTSTAAALGLDMLSAYQMPAEEYCARVLARTCEAVIEADDPTILLCNYTQLPDLVFSDILGHFGYHPHPSEIQVMQAATKRDAKEPLFEFVQDSERKQLEATPRIRGLAETLVMPLYTVLEERRLRQEEMRRSHS